MTTIIERKWNKYIRCQAEYYTPQMQMLLQDVEHRMQTPWKILKDDPTSTVVVIKVDDQYLVVKRANTKDFFHFARRLISVSRAKKNWQNAKKLQKCGIKTFFPIAFVEERWGPFKGRSYFMCTLIEGEVALNYFSKNAKAPHWEEVIYRISLMVKHLANHWLSHRDLNLSNIILVDKEPYLIDLDSMRQHRLPFLAKRGARREFERFMNNCLSAPGVYQDFPRLLASIFFKKAD